MAETISREQTELLLAAAAQDVLETMFFATVFGNAEAAEPSLEPELLARLTFRGTPSGVFHLCVPRGTARSIAADFLGAEEEADLTEAQVEGVVCELLNMISGDALSRLESKETIELTPPSLVNALELPPEADVIRISLELESGTLTLYFFSIDETA
jgi:CheY-specific phosphatase CheX